MKKNLTKLILIASLSNFAYADTTGNLVSQDFTSGWTNTGNSYHGDLTIAGHHNGTVESDSVSLNAEGINKESLNNGFSITGSANVWFWNNETQSVTQTIKTVDDNGEVITQNRTLSGSCATWNGCTYGSMTDTLIIGSNSQQDYDVNLKYSFSVPNQTSGHYGADLKDPSLTVSYTYVPPLDSATQTALLDLNNDIKDELKDVDTFEFKNEEIKLDSFESFTEEQTFDDFKEDDFSTDTMLVDNKEETPNLEPKEELSGDQGSTFTETAKASDEKTDAPVSSAEDSQDPREPQTEEEEPSSLQAEQSSNEEEDTSQETSSEEEQNTEVADDNNDNASSEKKSVSLADNIKAIDVKVKDPGKNMELKNLVKLDAMIDNTMLLSYANLPFYKDKKIYTDQINIFDNRILYDTVTLVSYQQNDPIFQREKALFDIRQEKQKLIKELEILKNGKT